MYQEIIESKKEDLEKSIAHLKEELNQIRTGRASAALVEGLMIDYYGAKSPLSQVASITVPEPRTITITPWSKDTLINIEKALRESQLNLNPNNDGEVIRLNIPPLNEERRKELVKILNQKAEDAKISIRMHREDVWEEIQKLEKEGGISEDDKFKGKDNLQDVINEYNKKVEEIRSKKEEEIMTV